jgi:hypothetical protein
LILTATNGQEALIKAKADRVWAQMQGAKGYIAKPYVANEIIYQINSLQSSTP